MNTEDQRRLDPPANANGHQHPGEPSTEKAARDSEFAEFYRSEMPKLIGFLAVQGAHISEAADVAQETMIAAYREWDQIAAPRAWIRTVASRQWWRWAKRDSTEIALAELPEANVLLSSQLANEIENRHALLELLRDLPVVQRQVMAWTYDGYRPTEIAALLDKEPASVRSALREARATLRSKYRSLNETD